MQLSAKLTHVATGSHAAEPTMRCVIRMAPLAAMMHGFVFRGSVSGAGVVGTN